MKETDELARDWFRSSVSSPGMPKTYLTPSASRHSTNTSDALLAAMSLPSLDPTTAPRTRLWCSNAPMRRSATLAAALLPALLAAAAPAGAAERLVIKGHGYGHGIGM